MTRAPAAWSYEQATAYLDGLILPAPRPRALRERLGLQPITRLLARLGDPHAGLRCIHIAGSKGKGSVALFAEAVLEAGGVLTGVFSSPHLERWTERIRVAGREIGAAEFSAALATLCHHIEALQRIDADSAPSFFDALTAAALWVFREAGVGCALIETGLGGRLDATNVCRPVVTCITTIEHEHRDKLGTTLTAIAGEKAGIIKPRIPLVLGALPVEARAVIEARAHAVGAPSMALDEQITVRRGATDDTWNLELAGLGVVLGWPRIAPTTAANAALAAACVQASGLLSRTKLADSLGTALPRTRLPGRMELIAEHPWLVADGAHTERSILALRDWLSAFPPRRRHFVLSLTHGKDPGAVLQPLLDIATSIIATRADAERSLPAATLAARIVAAAPDLPVHVIDDPSAALHAARDRLAPEELLCATGSMYLAGRARRYFEDQSLTL